MDYLRYYLTTLLTTAGIAGFWLGGQWVWLGASTILLVLLLDLLLGPDLARRKVHHPGLVALPLYLHVLLMTALYAALCWRVGQGFGTTGTLGMVSAVVGTVLSLGWLGAIPNVPVAHELGHRSDKFSQFLADYLATFFGDPTRWISHNMGHHLDVATERDGDTAYRGESVYHFIPRASMAALRDAWQAETTRLRNSGIAVWSPRSRIARAAAMLLVLAVALYWAAGWPALVLGLAGVATAKAIAEGLNYLQHYGLIRLPEEPFAPRHAWNHLSWATRAATVEITTHAQHHQDSAVAFTELTPYPDAPRMPSGALCFLCAMVPPVWERYIARPRLANWDQQHASSAERELARAANQRAHWSDTPQDA